MDREKQNHFITIDNLRSKIPLFFSKDKVSVFQKIFRNNTIDELENKVKLQPSRTANVTDLSGDNKLAEYTRDLSFKEIEIEIKKLRDEEKKTSIKSNVDLDKYKKAKEEYLSKKSELVSEFFSEFNSLPESLSVLGFLFMSFLLLFLFFASLYHFTFWLEALIATGIITTTLGVAAIIVLYCFRRKVFGVVNKIKLENIAIFKSFNDYVSSLKEIAVAIRESTLRRKNIHELEKKKEIIDNIMQKRFAYSKFYKDIVEQIGKNGKKIETVSCEHESRERIDHLLPPYRDERLANFEFEKKKLVVEIGNTNVKDFSEEGNFNPLLNVIQLIEIV